MKGFREFIIERGVFNTINKKIGSAHDPLEHEAAMKLKTAAIHHDMAKQKSSIDRTSLNNTTTAAQALHRKQMLDQDRETQNNAAHSVRKAQFDYQRARRK